MAKSFFYTDEHINFLKKGYMSMSVPKLTTAFNLKFNLNKSSPAIASTLKSRKIKCGRNSGELSKGVLKSFTQEHREWFIKKYPLFSRKELTIEFNKTFNESRPEKQVIAFLKNHKIKSGRTGHYKAGVPSWSKGKKGIFKANSGSFKKGQKAHNWLPVGSVRTIKDNYLEIKTAEPNTWTGKHRLVWESVNGKIPDKHVVRFKDGDHTNCEIDNLFLVNRAEHQFLNALNFKEQHPEHKETIILIAKVQAQTSKIMRNANQV